MKPIRISLILLFAGFLMVVPYANAQDKIDDTTKKKTHSIAISKEMDDVMIQEAVNSLSAGVTILDAADPALPIVYVNEGFSAFLSDGI